MCSSSKFQQLVNALNINNETKKHFELDLQLMLVSSSKDQCSTYKSTILGMLSALELESIISTEEHDELCKELGSLWSAMCTSIDQTSRVISKNQAKAKRGKLHGK